MTTVISAKISDELRRKTRIHHIKISQVVRRAIEEEVRKIEQEKLSKDLDNLSSILHKNVGNNEIIKAIRSSRDER